MFSRSTASDNTNTGASGDTSNKFTASNNRVDFEADPSALHGSGDAHGTGILSSITGTGRSASDASDGLFGSSGITNSTETSGAKWRDPQNRGAAGDFDDWNPRGELGSGGPNTPGGSITESIKGKWTLPICRSHTKS
jgi:hypothetical protein